MLSRVSLSQVLIQTNDFKYRNTTLKRKKIDYKPLFLSSAESKNERLWIYKLRSHMNSSPSFAEETNVCECIFHVGGRQQAVLKVKMEYLKTKVKLTPEKANFLLTGGGKTKTRYNRMKDTPWVPYLFALPFLIIIYF